MRELTIRIFRSLITLGVLEDVGKPLTGRELLDYLGSIKINSAKQIDRIIHETLTSWLEKDKEIIIGGSPRSYKINFQSISEDKYKDFLDVLLSLYEIGNRQFDSSIDKLYIKNGQPALGILSKLILASKMTSGTNKELLVKYENFENEFYFIPWKLRKKSGYWVVDGEILNNFSELEPPLDISKIISVRNIN